MKKALILIIVFAVAALALFAGCAAKAQSGKLYTCPMHAQVLSDRPGQCPICGMDLIPVKETPKTVSNSPTALTVSGEQEQLIGVKTEKAEKRTMSYTVRTAGKIAHDPELYNAVIEYRLAVRSFKSAEGEARDQAKSSLASARVKMLHEGLSEQMIDAFASAKEEPEYLLFAGKKGGKLLVYIQVYESEINYIKEGARVDISAVSFPGSTYQGSILSLDTYVDKDTRTLRARAEIANTDGTLRPEMLITAAVKCALGERLAVPNDAVLDTGIKQSIFVKTAPGIYEPRQVRTGVKGEGYIEIVSGIKEGEDVAISANFLLDSESKLRELRK